MSFYIIDYKLNDVSRIFRVEASNKGIAIHKLRKYINRMWNIIYKFEVLSIVKLDKKLAEKYRTELDEVERILNASLLTGI